MKNRISLTVLFLVALVSNNIYSQWSTDPTVNNPICTLPSEQGSPKITSDGSGGAIIVWDDWRNGGNDNHDIYAQRIDASGTVLWTIDGIPICTLASSNANPAITSDGSGGAIITWVDFRNDGNYDIYAQRIDADGTILWATDGVPISTDIGYSYNPVLTGDGNGGAFVAWWDLRNSPFNADIYAQRIDANGTLLWGTDVEVCIAANEQRYPTITSDGGNGVIIAWQDDRSGSTIPDIYAQRINSSGTALWTTDGVAVCTQASYQRDPTITSDGSGNAILTWHDYRNGNADIYAQRINSSGTVLWATDGVAVCTLPLNQESPTIASDGGSGAIITWIDGRNGSDGGYSDIYAQKINSSGATQWGSDVEISTNFAAQYYPAITSAGSGNAIITWYDYRAMNNDIYATKVFSDGSLPVELTTFTSTKGIDNTIVLHWSTAVEVNNFGFEIQRAIMNDELGMMNWNKVGFVEGNGTTNSPKNYSFTDKNVSSDKVVYRLKQIDRDGKFSYSPEVEVTVGSVPKVFALEQNYPNPFNPTTTINYQLPMSSFVTLKVFDMLGKEVAILVNEEKSAGTYEVKFDAKNLASGIYFVRLISGDKVQLKKMALMK